MAVRISNGVRQACAKDWLDRPARSPRDLDDAPVAAISAHFGRRMPEEARLLEIVPVMTAPRHVRWHLRRWMRLPV